MNIRKISAAVRAELVERHDSRALRARHGRGAFLRFALTGSGAACAVLVAFVAIMAVKEDSGAAEARAIMGGEGPAVVAKGKLPLLPPVAGKRGDIVVLARLPQPRPAKH